ncbi:hypothetical protein H4R35_004862 [Dimargaris xerosporica]|nr:hypothetical protein H4R35_004862 [Dimargaris xerosporica]
MESTLPPYRDAPRWKRVLAVVFAVFSAALIWSELTFNVAHPQLSIFAHIMHSLNLSYAALEFVSFFTMAYMCACAYTMLMKVNLFHIYALAPNHQTNERSLLFCGSYLCRLTMPLCYNYLTLSRAMDGPVYSQFMGQIDLVPFLGDAFNAWFPILILLPALFTLFRVHSRIFQLFDASDALDGDESGTSLQIEEGRNLIEEARKAMERSGTLQAVVGPGGPAARYDSARRHRARFVPRNQRPTGADPMHDPNDGSGQPILVSTNNRARTRQDRSGSRTYLLQRSETSTPASLSEQDGSDSELLSSARSGPPGNPQPSHHSRNQTLANSNEASPTVFQRGWQWLRRQVPSAASSARPFPGTDADSQPLAPQPTGLPSSTSARHPDPDDEVYDWESGQYLRRSHPNPWATETSASGVSSVSGGPTNPPRNIFDGL